MSWGLVRHALNEGGERASVNVEIDRPSGEAVQSSTRTAVLVLGMHRSGTSSLAGTLVRLGGAAPLNLVPPRIQTTQGVFGNLWVLMALNDEILAAGGSHWQDWRQFDSERIDAAARVTLRARAKSALADEFGDASLADREGPPHVQAYALLVFGVSGSRMVCPSASPAEIAT